MSTLNMIARLISANPIKSMGIIIPPMVLTIGETSRHFGGELPPSIYCLPKNTTKKIIHYSIPFGMYNSSR